MKWSLRSADLDSAFYWAALRHHPDRRCSNATPAGRRRFPPMRRMPGTAVPPATRSLRSMGTGTLYSWVRVHRPGQLTPTPTGDLPYTVAVVELDAGLRVIARFEGEPCIGAAATPAFEDHDEWTELRYRVVP